jgi:hypothetical protein
VVRTDGQGMGGYNQFNTTNGWTAGTYALAATETRYQLVVDGNVGDALQLESNTSQTGFWSDAGTVSNGDVTYRVYNHSVGTGQVLMRDGMTAPDTSAPTVSSVTLTSATGAMNNTLNAGDVLTATVTLNEAVTVTGTPQLALNIGGTVVQANYASGSGTTALTFTYTIASGQTDGNGVAISANSLRLNSGTIRDAVGNSAVLSHAAVADNSSYMVDTTAPFAQIDLVGTMLANNSNLVYSHTTGSFYRLTSTATTWESANSAAAASSLMGHAGHLLHINSASENTFAMGASGYNGARGWLGASDKGTEGSWQWWYGANASNPFWSGVSTGSPQNGAYNNWSAGEPNDAGSNEDYAEIFANGTWNDLPPSFTQIFLTEWEGSAVLNRQFYSPTQSIKVASSEVGATGFTAYLVNALDTVSTVSQITSLDTSRWNSVAMTTGALTVLSNETFSSAPTGWTSTAAWGSVSTAGNLGGEMNGFLGRFGDGTGNQVLSKTYNFGAAYANQTVQIDFDMLEIDSWDGELFLVYLNNSVASAQQYHASSVSIKDGGRDLGNLSTDSNGGGTNVLWTEEKHHYSLRATLDANGSVKLGFGSTLNQSINDESWGIDNVVITTVPSSSTLSLAGLVDGDYKLYTADAAGNLSAASADSIMVGTPAGIASTHNATLAPVLVDMDGDGVVTLSQVLIDLNGDGANELSDWVAPGDAILFHDKHRNGEWLDLNQVAFKDYGGNTDLEGLAVAFDTNMDGLFDAHDAEFEHFALWQDLNQNGQVDTNELQTLLSLGVESIVLTSDNQAQRIGNSVVHGQTQVVLHNGEVLNAFDVSLAYTVI